MLRKVTLVRTHASFVMGLSALLRMRAMGSNGKSVLRGLLHLEFVRFLLAIGAFDAYRQGLRVSET